MKVKVLKPKVGNTNAEVAQDGVSLFQRVRQAPLGEVIVRGEDCVRQESENSEMQYCGGDPAKSVFRELKGHGRFFRVKPCKGAPKAL